MALMNYSPNVRARFGGLAGRGRRVNSLAAAVDDKGVAFGGESVSGVLVDRGFHAQNAQQHKSKKRRAPHFQA